MKKFQYLFGGQVAAASIIVVLGLTFFQAAPALADGPCFCYGVGNADSGCKPQTGAQCDANFINSSLGAHFDTCESQTDATACNTAFTNWKNQQATAPPAAKTQAAGEAATKSKFIPDCTLTDQLDLNGPCGDVSIFVVLLLNASNYLFTIIGAIALAVFVYGGFLLIVSQGNEEKITKGMDAIKAAIIGLAVAFGGYFLIHFLGQTIGLKATFGL